jgi:hypothetical protein
MNCNIHVCNWNDIGRFISVHMSIRILVDMVKSNDIAADKIGYDRRVHQQWLVHQANTVVLNQLVEMMGRSTVETINFHLRLLVGVDLSHVASEPRLVESGLRTFFGSGAAVIMQAAILAMFRSVHLIPERDFISLEDAIEEFCSQAPNSHWNSTKAHYELHD